MDLIEIGKVGRAHGLKGEFRLTYYNLSLEDFFVYKKIFLKGPTDKITSFSVEQAKKYKKGIIVKLKGIETREEAKKYINSPVMVSEDALPPLKEGEYYVKDLIGMDVISVSGKFIGKLKDVMILPNYDLYIINYNEYEFYLPAIKDIIVKIDERQRKIFVNPPEGLLSNGSL